MQPKSVLVAQSRRRRNSVSVWANYVHGQCGCRGCGCCPYAFVWPGLGDGFHGGFSRPRPPPHCSISDTQPECHGGCFHLGGSLNLALAKPPFPASAPPVNGAVSPGRVASSQGACPTALACPLSCQLRLLWDVPLLSLRGPAEARWRALDPIFPLVDQGGVASRGLSTPESPFLVWAVDSSSHVDALFSCNLFVNMFLFSLILRLSHLACLLFANF